MQYLNNQPNIPDQSKSVTDVLEGKTGLKEMKIRSPDKLILGHESITRLETNLIP